MNVMDSVARRAWVEEQLARWLDPRVADSAIRERIFLIVVMAYTQGANDAWQDALNMALRAPKDV